MVKQTHPEAEVTLNIDRNVNAKHFEGNTELVVTHTFYTLQGERPFSGTPVIFIRTAGCNRGAKLGMNCEFCDSQFFIDKGKSYSHKDLVGNLIDLCVTQGALPQVLIISGGEPLLQQTQLISFLKYLRTAPPEDFPKSGDLFIARHLAMTPCQLETNGDLFPKPEFLNLLRPHLSHNSTVALEMSQTATTVVTPTIPKILWDGAVVVSPKNRTEKHIQRYCKAFFDGAHRVPLYLRTLISSNPKSTYHDPSIYKGKGFTEKFVSPMTFYHEDGSINAEASRKELLFARDFCLSNPNFALSTQTHLTLGIE